MLHWWKNLSTEARTGIAFYCFCVAICVLAVYLQHFSNL
jgi:hypothetical protein